MVPTLNYVTLTFVLQAIRDGNFQYCNALGLTLDEIIEINKLSIDDLFFISKSPLIFIDVTVNHERLKHNLLRSRSEVYLQQQINRAVRLGASHEILHNFFGLNSYDVAARRKLLGISISSGRTIVPDEYIDAKIWSLWKKKRPDNIESLQALDVMMQITENLNNDDRILSLTVIRNRIVLFENNNTGGGK